jgi:hypothetical protein
MRLCRGAYGNFDLPHCGRRGCVANSCVMMGVMMGQVIVQKPPEVTKRAGELSVRFDCRRWGMLLGGGTVGRLRVGGVWGDS